MPDLPVPAVGSLWRTRSTGRPVIVGSVFPETGSLDYREDRRIVMGPAIGPTTSSIAEFLKAFEPVEERRG